jgi:hypothetical protein
MVNTVAPPPGGIQIVQQIMGPNGEIQQIPIQLTNQQLQLIRAQMTGKTTKKYVFLGGGPEVFCDDNTILIIKIPCRHFIDPCWN